MCSLRVNKSQYCVYFAAGRASEGEGGQSLRVIMYSAPDVMSPTRRHEPQPCHQLCDEDAEKLSLTSVNKRTEYLEGKG